MESEKGYGNLRFLYIPLLMFITVSFSINLMIILIHCKQRSLRKGFFIIIMVQIVMEALINLILLLISIVNLFEIKITNLLFSLSVIFNFGYVTLILYNIRIVYYLMTLNQEKEESKNYDSEDDDLNTRHKTIVLEQSSFKRFHIFCFLLSIIHTILYTIKVYNDKQKLITNKIKWNWFYYYLNGNEGYERFSLYIFHIIFFIISVPYLFLSYNKSKITEHIYLKRFSLYCIFSAITSLLFPISLLITYIDILKDRKEIIYFIILIAFLIYLFVTSFFRVNCYYVQHILEENGKSFCKKCSIGFHILFCCKKIPEPNFVDLNSAFVYHSLANINDFLELTNMDLDSENSQEMH